MADWTEKNRSHFNNTASTYNRKFGNTILQLIEEIQSRRDWLGVDWIEDEDDEAASQKSVRLLDYACGTGMVSRSLAPYISQALGIDLSPSMVEEYNTSASNQGIPEDEMHAVVGNLIDSSKSLKQDPIFEGKEWWDFDIAAVGLGWHHFVDPAFAAKVLAGRLRRDGVLCVVDFLPHTGGHGHHHSHSHTHTHGDSREDTKPESQEGKMDGYGDSKLDEAASDTVMHFGFAREDMKKMFEEAGAGVDFDFVVLGKGVVFEKEGRKSERSVFIAKGKKA